ncbi:MAG: tRNA-dihydrouridine synthase family protein [Bacteroidales bacterium]|nr:tRNA-dihydrouridine synthase family protein [Bacteroidales bacterium]
MILAPMQGLTEVLFRRVFYRHFAGLFNYAVAPFVSLTHGNLADATKKIDDLLPDANRDSMPVVPQILGKEPTEFVELANRLCDLGYTEINWNLGCPMRKVAAKHRGSGMLPYPDELRHVLDQVVPAIRVSLSIKMRLGLTNRDEIFALVPILNDYPIANVTIHPRIGRQQYTGHVDLETFARVKPLLKHSVIYNGDITTLEEYKTIVGRFTDLFDVMIGRGILYDPTLPLQIKQNRKFSAEEKKLSTTTFIADLINEIDRRLPTDEAKLRKTKEYWCLISRSLPITEQQARSVLHATTLAETQQLIFNFIQ